MRLHQLLIALSLLIAITSCKTKTSENTEELQKDTATIKLDFTKIYDTSLNERNVILDGYFQIPFSIFSYSNSRNTINFTSWKNYPDTLILKVSIDVSDKDSNSMLALPSSYHKSDLIVISATGDTIRYGDKARIHGLFSCAMVVSGEDSGKIFSSININYIEKIKEDITYSTNTIKKHPNPVDSANSHNLERVYIEGYLEMPHNMIGLRGGFTLLLHVNELDSDFVGAHIITDNGPNSLDIPSYIMTESDVKLYDHLGNKIPFNTKTTIFGTNFISKKKVRLYGIWGKPKSTDGTGDLHVEWIEVL